MRLTIEIPEQIYLNAKDDMLCGSEVIVNAIKNGIPQEPKTDVLASGIMGTIERANGLRHDSLL